MGVLGGLQVLEEATDSRTALEGGSLEAKGDVHGVKQAGRVAQFENKSQNLKYVKGKPF